MPLGWMLTLLLLCVPVGPASLNLPRVAAAEAVIEMRQDSDAGDLARAKALFDQASSRIDAEDLTAAEPLLRDAVAIQRKRAPGSVALAKSLSALGNVTRARFDLKTAEPLLREAVDMLGSLAPDTTDFAVSLNNLGNLRWRQGAIEEAATLYQRALPILERSEATARDAAVSIMGIGITLFLRGRLAEGEPYYRRALAVEERLAPGTARVARVLNNLGGLMYRRGALLDAEDLYLRALAIHRRVAPQSQEVGSTLHNIGLIHYERGDRVRAGDYLKEALDIKERLAPDGLPSASTLESLSNIARDRRDLEAASTLLQRALAITEREAPRSLGLATLHNNLANVLMDRGNLTAARERYEKSRSLLEQVAPAGLEMAIVLDRLVEVAQRQGEGAEPIQRLAADSLGIVERIAPNSAAHAFALRRIGRLARDRGELSRAASAYSQALDAIEVQSQRLGGTSEVRTIFASQRRAMYLEFMDILMTLRQSAEAFDVFERSRARGLLSMLAERDLVLDADVSIELKQALRELREEDDRLQASLARLGSRGNAEEIERLRARQRELREKRNQQVERLRAASPRLAALQYPQPLTLSQVQQSLDRGTVLLSYQVGAATSRLFIVRAPAAATRANLEVRTLAIDEDTLRQQIAAFRRLIERDAVREDGAAPAFIAAARQLYDILIAPAAADVAAADRVLILPDGPLHSLPFAALMRPSPGSGTGRGQYFIEWKPLHTSISATVYAELRRGARRPSTPQTLVAFADPQYSAGRSEGAGGSLTPLPATRAEVQAVARGFGRQATVLLGAEATEARAKSIGPARYLHFATHGLLDARSPLDSALALTVPADRRPGEENGLLQAWEILEQVRIDADLVTLSACETALGDDVAGEGLVGLTRAFHYAGARSVLATLWQVADEATSTLMSSFYGHLRAGRSKDDALRRAQVESIARPSTAAPFHWAAFTLSGDWR